MPATVTTTEAVFGVKRPSSSRRSSLATLNPKDGQITRQIQAAEDAGDYDMALKLRYSVLHNVAEQKKYADEQFQTFGGTQQGQAAGNSAEVLLEHGEEFIRRLNFYALMLINQRAFKEASKLLSQAASFVASDPLARPIDIFGFGLSEGKSNITLHRCAATIENNMGLCAFKANRLGDAEIHFFACAAMEEQLGSAADNPAGTLYNLAQVQSALRKHKAAAECSAAAAEHLSARLADDKLLLVQQDEARQLLLHVLLLKGSSERELRDHAKAMVTYRTALQVSTGDHSPVDGLEMVKYIENLLLQCQSAAKREKINPSPRRASSSASRPSSAMPQRAASIASAYEVYPNTNKALRGHPAQHRSKQHQAPKPVNERMAPYYRREKVVTTLVPNSGLLHHADFDSYVAPPMPLSAATMRSTFADSDRPTTAGIPMSGNRVVLPSLSTVTTPYENVGLRSVSDIDQSLADASRAASKSPIPLNGSINQRPTSVSFVEGMANAIDKIGGKQLKVPTRPTTAPTGRRPPSASSSRSNIPGVPVLRDSPLVEHLPVSTVAANLNRPPIICSNDGSSVQMPPASLVATHEQSAANGADTWSHEHFEPLVVDDADLSRLTDEKTTEDWLIAAALRLTAPRTVAAPSGANNSQLANVFGQSPMLRDIYGKLNHDHRRAFEELASKPLSPNVTIPPTTAFTETSMHTRKPLSPQRGLPTMDGQSAANVENRSPTRYFPWAPPNSQPVPTLRRNPVARNNAFNVGTTPRRTSPQQSNNQSPVTTSLTQQRRMSNSPGTSNLISPTNRNQRRESTQSASSPTRNNNFANANIIYGSTADELFARATEFTTREVAAEILQAAGRAMRDRRRMGNRKRMADEIRNQLREEVRGHEQAVAEGRAMGIIRDHDRQLEVRWQAMGTEAAAVTEAAQQHRMGGGIVNEDIINLFQASVVNIPSNAAKSLANNSDEDDADESNASNRSPKPSTDFGAPQVVTSGAVEDLILRQRQHAQRIHRFNEEQHKDIRQEQEKRKEHLATLCVLQAHLRAKASLAVAKANHERIRSSLLEDYAVRQQRVWAVKTLARHEPEIAERRRNKKLRAQQDIETKEALKAHGMVIDAFSRAAVSSLVAQYRLRLQWVRASNVLEAFFLAKDSELVVQSARVDEFLFEFKRQSSAAVAIQRIFKGFVARANRSRLMKDFLDAMYANKVHYAASKIQATFRMHFYGKPVRPLIAEDAAARFRLAEAEARRLRLRAVAPIIQRAYRSHIARRALAFLKNSILMRRREYLSLAIQDNAVRTIQQFSRIVAAKGVLRRQREVMGDILKFRERQRNRMILEHTERSVVRITAQLLQRMGKAYFARRALRFRRIQAVADYEKQLLQINS